jgi:hypothetical protein
MDDLATLFGPRWAFLFQAQILDINIGQPYENNTSV